MLEFLSMVVPNGEAITKLMQICLQVFAVKLMIGALDKSFHVRDDGVHPFPPFQHYTHICAVGKAVAYEKG
jgi:hypothetical protein